MSLFRALRQYVLPLVIWSGFFFLRPLFYSPHCAIIPTPCTVESVNAFDRVVFHFGSISADFWSNVLQNTVGAIAFLLPWLWYGQKNASSAWKENKQLLLTMLWNGAALEFCRTLAQRPRPLVYTNPLVEGANIQQYTSFYSGHTSFVALATLFLYFAARRRFPRFPAAGWIALTLSILATCLIACLRVWGGRHYPSDTLFGFAVGVGLSWGLNQRQEVDVKERLENPH